jgi:hypothetical protein
MVIAGVYSHQQQMVDGSDLLAELHGAHLAHLTLLFPQEHGIM